MFIHVFCLMKVNMQRKLPICEKKAGKSPKKLSQRLHYEFPKKVMKKFTKKFAKICKENYQFTKKSGVQITNLRRNLLFCKEKLTLLILKVIFYIVLFSSHKSYKDSRKKLSFCNIFTIIKEAFTPYML